LDVHAFSYWSNAKKGWAIGPGKFLVRVGDSRENTPLTTEIEVE
jgi:hypothetical protein